MQTVLLAIATFLQIIANLWCRKSFFGLLLHVGLLVGRLKKVWQKFEQVQGIFRILIVVTRINVVQKLLMLGEKELGREVNDAIGVRSCHFNLPILGVGLEGSGGTKVVE